MAKQQAWRIGMPSYDWKKPLSKKELASLGRDVKKIDEMLETLTHFRGFTPEQKAELKRILEKYGVPLKDKQGKNRGRDYIGYYDVRFLEAVGGNVAWKDHDNEPHYYCRFNLTIMRPGNMLENWACYKARNYDDVVQKVEAHLRWRASCYIRTMITRRYWAGQEASAKKIAEKEFAIM